MIFQFTWLCLTLVTKFAEVSVGSMLTIADYPPIFLDDPLYIMGPTECDTTDEASYAKVVFHGFINLAKMTHEDRYGGLITLNFRTHVFFDFTGLCVLWLDTTKTNVCERKKLGTDLDDPTFCSCGAIREMIIPVYVSTRYQSFFQRAQEIMLHWTSFTSTGTISSPPRIAKIPKYGYYVNNCAHQPRVIISFKDNHYPAYSKNGGSSLWLLPALLMTLTNTIIWMT
ncbi:hypothetical protein Btru_070539 [Bulinus truncatus]|nr:hypothetical protein Btru_070539 [Bulinus truncatus]